MKTLGIILLLIVVAAIGLALWVRVAPSREADWHVDLAAPGFTPGANWAAFCPAPDSRWASAEAPDLGRVRQIALDWPRTQLLFGSPEAGRMTFVTRSRLMGFPDYTTVGVRDGQLCIVARQRFGLEDLGVNAARVGAWAQAYLGSGEAPALGWPEA